jgi:hypothetical protein
MSVPRKAVKKKMEHITTTIHRLTILVAIALLLAVSTVLAQTGNGYDLTWWTVDGGGGTVSNGGSGYTLMGVAGQPDAGPALTGGGYTLVGGFWPGAASGGGNDVYLPIIMKNH